MHIAIFNMGVVYEKRSRKLRICLFDRLEENVGKNFAILMAVRVSQNTVT